jgi:heavy-metal resistance protein
VSKVQSRLAWGIRTILVCSVVLNVALSVEILHPSGANSAGPDSVIPPQLERIIQRLPPEDSKRFKAALGHHIPAVLANRVRADELSAQSLRLIQAEPLNLPALKLTIGQIRHARQANVDELLAAFYECLPEMSAQGRKQLAANWREQAAGAQ